MNRLSVRINWLKLLQDCRKITDHFGGIYKTYPNLINENRRMWTCNRLDLGTLGSQPVMMPKNLPDHWIKLHVVTLFANLCGTLVDNIPHNYPLRQFLIIVISTPLEEPAVSYRWTGWVWKITGWSSRLQREESIEYTSHEWKHQTGRCQHVTGGIQNH